MGLACVLRVHVQIEELKAALATTNVGKGIWKFWQLIRKGLRELLNVCGPYRYRDPTLLYASPAMRCFSLQHR